MTDILFILQELKNQGKPFALCMLIESTGSTPRKAGARMVVFGDGSIKGTIGGGAVEMQVIEDAKQVLIEGRPVKKAYQLAADLEMPCGGNIEVYFEPFFGDHKLYIFGAGHVGREVGKYAKDFGFSIIFVDHRPEIYKEFECKYANCMSGEYLQILSQLEFTPRDFVVITTPSHEFDEMLLERLAQRSLAYLGMIGSKRKVAEIRKRLLSEKALTEEQLKVVDMPIGLPFKAETPAEIAISILAKLLDVKNQFIR